MMFMLCSHLEETVRVFSGAWSPSQQQAANVHGFIVSLKSARFPPDLMSIFYIQSMQHAYAGLNKFIRPAVIISHKLRKNQTCLN